MQAIMLELPDDLAEQAKAVAADKGCRLEDVIMDWVRRAAAEVEFTSLDDSALLELCGPQMPESEQRELSELLASHREGELDGPKRDRLAALMDRYRRDLGTMARATAEAKKRNLKP